MIVSDSADQVNSSGLALPDIEQPFLGRWHLLVSTTNWEKGRIIYEWREALIVAGAPLAEYTDEAWSQRVGGVTSQHVGRLRRVYQRFGQTHERYPNLFWSHYQAAIDWDDADMWLEGAAQNDWSVAQMKRTRNETLGLVEQENNPVDVATAEPDEDYVPLDGVSASGAEKDRAHFESEPAAEGPDFGDSEELADSDDVPHQSDEVLHTPGEEREPVRPFENLAELPADLADAFDAFKLAILRHKTEGWQQIQRADVLASLDALKELTLAPSDEAA